jgi:hypothetical protein
MTEHALPTPGTFVELTTADEPVRDVRVVAADEAVITLSLAISAVPAPGTTMVLRWPAGERGRFARDAAVVKADENRVDVRPTGVTRLEQQRHFVRGGGGEPMVLSRPGRPDAVGAIRDISEQSVRAHLTDVELAEGEEFGMRAQLGEDIIEARATVVRVACLRQTVPHRGPVSVEFVAVFHTDERQAKIIRRYVLQQQARARTRSAG